MKGSDNINQSQRNNFEYNTEMKDDSFPFELSAASISSDIGTPFKEDGLDRFIKSVGEGVKDVIPFGLDRVLGAALLITSNTVGASMMVLPELVTGPGLLVSSGVFFGKIYK